MGIVTFNTFNNKIREIGRKVVCPSNQIYRLLCKYVFANNVDLFVDFGAGTLFWSKMFKEKVNKIYAVDVIYTNSNDMKQEIACVDDIQKVPMEGKKKCFWCCDVLHHLDLDFQKYLFEKWIDNFEYVCIKDIDCNKKFGNFMNRVHDRVINGEIIRDINPNEIVDILSEKGYRIKRFNLRKLWYPHFLIVAEKVVK